MTCPACDSTNRKTVLYRKELATDGQSERRVHYIACGDCGLVEKVGTIDERAYYEGAWQFEERERPDGAEYLKRLLFLHGSRCKKGMEVGMPASNRYLARLGVQDAVDGCQWFGTGPTMPTPGDCDVIVMCHVLEHVLDIHHFLSDVEGYATPSAMLYIEVPSLEFNAAHQYEFGDSFWKWNEDLSRTHNWHFTIPSLVALARKRGWSVLHADTSNVDGFQSNRMLVKRGGVGSRGRINQISDMEFFEYEKATLSVYGRDPLDTALYGASQSYYKLRHVDERRRIEKFRLFDLYRHGQRILDKAIEHPDGLSSFKTVVVLPSFKPSRDACTHWLMVNHPHLDIVHAFPDKMADMPAMQR